MMTENKNIGYCIECGAELRLKRSPYIGQQVTCRYCDTPLEVYKRSPVEFKGAGIYWDEGVDKKGFKKSKRRH